MTFKEYLEIEESKLGKKAKNALLVATAGLALAGGLKLLDRPMIQKNEPKPKAYPRVTGSDGRPSWIVKQAEEKQKELNKKKEAWRKIKEQP